MEGFVRYYNYERCHEALGNITPADMYHGRQDAILATRQEVKQKSLAERRFGKSENCLSRLASKLHASKAPLLSHLF